MEFWRQREFHPLSHAQFKAGTTAKPVSQINAESQNRELDLNGQAFLKSSRDAIFLCTILSEFVKLAEGQK